MNKKTPLDILKKHFSFSSFRAGQEEIIRSVLSGKDTLGVMPTGSGKSLCYQIPALMLPGITLIISPLIALMKDQVDALQKLGIAAAFLNSSLRPAQTEERLSALRRGQYKLLYVAPERFRVASFMKLIHQLDVSLLAVDEAHCISQWGHDFRPSYLKIKDIVRQVGRPPVVALTATATKVVQKDIIKQLRMEKANIIVKGFDRPNLKFFVAELDEEEQKQRELVRIINSVKGAGIVYVATKKAVSEISGLLNKNGLKSTGYHGGMDKKQRVEAQNTWLRGEHPIIVATNAFGMGIDKAALRFIIHYNMPGSVEAYYQEAGRAGRDSKTSYCVLLYTYRDHIIQDYLIENNFPPEHVLQEIYDFLFSLEQKNILLTYKQIGEACGSSEFQVASAIKLFERYHILKRMDKTALSYEVFFMKDLPAALKEVARAPMQKKLLDWFAESTVNVFSMEETLKRLQISSDQFNNTIRQLVGRGILNYTPPFRGRGIEITSTFVDWEKTPIDLEEYKRQEQLQRERLAIMEEYVKTKTCRRKYLLGYFGEKYSKANCGGCDICLNWHSPEEGQGIKTSADSLQKMLACVYEFDGLFGVTTIASILKGVKEDRFANWGADMSESFGILKKMKKEKITRLIYAAISKGYLERSSGKYPVLEITSEGIDKLA